LPFVIARRAAAEGGGGRGNLVAGGSAWPRALPGAVCCVACDLRGPRAAARGPETEAPLASEVLSLRPRAAARGQRRSCISCSKARAMPGPLDQTEPGFEGKQ